MGLRLQCGTRDGSARFSPLAEASFKSLVPAWLIWRTQWGICKIRQDAWGCWRNRQLRYRRLRAPDLSLPHPPPPLLSLLSSCLTFFYVFLPLRAATIIGVKFSSYSKSWRLHAVTPFLLAYIRIEYGFPAKMEGEFELSLRGLCDKMNSLEKLVLA